MQHALLPPGRRSHSFSRPHWGGDGESACGVRLLKHTNSSGTDTDTVTNCDECLYIYNIYACVYVYIHICFSLTIECNYHPDRFCSSRSPRARMLCTTIA